MCSLFSVAEGEFDLFDFILIDILLWSDLILVPLLISEGLSSIVFDAEKGANVDVELESGEEDFDKGGDIGGSDHVYSLVVLRSVESVD